MNVKDVITCLVKKEFIPNFDYVNTVFSFQTVFYHCAHSYRCCPCGFIHEYFDYISENGDFNEELLDLIVTNITNGVCPHVQHVPSHCIKETKVYAAHIAAAVGDEQAADDYFKHYKYIRSTLFNLTPFRVALVRKQLGVVNIANTYTQKTSTDKDLFPARKLMYAYRTNGQPDRIKVERISSTIFCLRHKDTSLLRGVLQPSVEHSDIDETLGYTFREEQEDGEADILEYLVHLCRKGRDAITVNCAVTAVVYDKPKVFQKILQLLYAGELNIGFYRFLYATCSVLQRNECAVILNSFDNRDPGDLNQFNTCLHLLSMFYGDHKSEILSVLSTMPEISECVNETYNDDMTLLHIYTSGIHPIEVSEVQSLIELGSDIDKVDFNGNSPLLHFLSKRHNITGFRETLEILLFENPDKCLNKDAVRKGIELDAHLETANVVQDTTGVFLIDAKEHALFGNNNTTDYALNFIGPFLIESGFHCGRDTIVSALELPLPAAEQEYLRQCLVTPRSLKVCCRDTLRGYFKGRHLHSLLEYSKVPKVVKDYVLLKNLFVTNTSSTGH